MQEEFQRLSTSRLPGLGLLLVGVEVLVFQGGSVVAKSLTTNPLLMLLIRDILQFTFQVPPSSHKSFSKLLTFSIQISSRCPQPFSQAMTLFLKVIDFHNLFSFQMFSFFIQVDVSSFSCEAFPPGSVSLDTSMRFDIFPSQTLP